MLAMASLLVLSVRMPSRFMSSFMMTKLPSLTTPSLRRACEKACASNARLDSGTKTKNALARCGSARKRLTWFTRICCWSYCTRDSTFSPPTICKVSARTRKRRRRGTGSIPTRTLPRPMKALDRVEHENGYSVMARGPADVTLFGKLAHCIRERTAVIDTHAADPRTHPVGGPDGNVRILAVGAEWTVENFLALIAAARQRLTLQEQLDAVDVDAGEDELDRRHAALEALGEADAHVRGILTLHRAGRIDLAALGAFAFWLATWLDERVERILCKHNVCLAHAGLGVPSAIQVRHVRQALPTILRRYVRGDVDSGQFFDEL